MFRVRWQGVEIECDSLSDALAAADAIRAKTRDPRAVAGAAKAAQKEPRPAGTKRGKAPKISEELAHVLHRRYARGESLSDLAAEANVGAGGALWARFKALGLPTGKAARESAS